jgi:ArsR family transcriptional regulator
VGHPYRREARLLRALAHPERLALLAVLRWEPACVCHLTAALSKPQAYVSQQLAILRAAGLIRARRQGVFTYYRLAGATITELVDLVEQMTGTPAAVARTANPRLEECACPSCRSPRSRVGGA